MAVDDLDDRGDLDDHLALLLAVPGPAGRRLAEVAGAAPELTVVRRVDDVAELLALADVGHGDVALVSGALAGVDRTTVTALGDLGAAVVGVVDTAPGHAAAAAADHERRRLLRLGVDAVVAAEDGPARLLEAARRATAVRLRAGAPPGWREIIPETLDRLWGPPRPGRVIAVWGPAGAPGRSTIAAALASLLAADGRPTLVLDADTYGGAQAPMLGLEDEAPGLLRACRDADRGLLDAAALRHLTVPVTPSLRVLTGLPHAQRWPQVRPAALSGVLEVAREGAEHIVVDCGFCLEDDEELSYDTSAPRRNGAALAVLAGADVLLAVARPDRVGLARFAEAWPVASAVAAPHARRVVVVNRVRPRGGRGWWCPQTMETLAGSVAVHPVPEDVEAVAAAHEAGRPVPHVRPRSALARALQPLADGLVRAP